MNQRKKVMKIVSSLVYAVLLAEIHAAGVTGKAFGFASETTGGGSATPTLPRLLPSVYTKWL